jgi:hypothetical protein
VVPKLLETEITGEAVGDGAEPPYPLDADERYITIVEVCVLVKVVVESL